MGCTVCTVKPVWGGGPALGCGALADGADLGCPGEGLRGDLSRLLTRQSADGPIQAAWAGFRGSAGSDAGRMLMGFDPGSPGEGLVATRCGHQGVIQPGSEPA